MDGVFASPQLLGLRRALLSEPCRPAAVRASSRAPWLVLATVCVGAFMGQLDVSIVTVALPRMGDDLHAGAGSVQWVSLAYLLVLVCTLVPVGRLADRVGRKLIYTYGFAVFTLGSAMCGLAPALGVLIAARLLQGLGAAMLQANGVALIAQTLPARELARGTGVQAAAQAVGLALGPAIGGLLLAAGSWRLIFLVNVPVGLVGIASGALLLPRSRSPRPSEGRGGLGVALLALLRGPAVARALVCGMASYVVMFGALYVLPYFLAASRLPSALAGLELATLPVALGIAAPLAGHLLGAGGRPGRTTDGRAAATAGLTLTAAGLFLLAFDHDASGRFAGLALAGVGLGVFMPLNNARVMAAAPPAQVGAMSGILNTARSLGTALGVALAGLLYATATHPAGAPLSAADRGLTATMGVLGTLALGAAMLSWRPRTRPSSPRSRPRTALPARRARA